MSADTRGLCCALVLLALVLVGVALALRGVCG
jgi:tetrahydromethanopterin S-methyltransferase subunit F